VKIKKTLAKYKTLKRRFYKKMNNVKHSLRLRIDPGFAHKWHPHSRSRGSLQRGPIVMKTEKSMYFLSTIAQIRTQNGVVRNDYGFCKSLSEV